MKVVLLAGKSASTPIVYNYLNKEIKIDAVLIEDKVPASQLLKRRLKKLGYATVFGQILFQILVVKSLQRQSKGRISNILAANRMQNCPIPAEKIINVTSVNDDEVVKILKQISPDVVVVNGTRIISKKVLDAVSATFINMHVGITPGYRGVHGAYWALVNGDKSNAGVTIHYIDQGIDTGKVIAQDTIDVTEDDNFTTYPYLQTAKGLSLMLNAIKSFEKGERPESVSKVTFSKLWSHPTIFQYLYNYVSKGIK
jgi:methionyl-tRNA formyltransferase